MRVHDERPHRFISQHMNASGDKVGLYFWRMARKMEHSLIIRGRDPQGLCRPSIAKAYSIITDSFNTDRVDNHFIHRWPIDN